MPCLNILSLLPDVMAYVLSRRRDREPRPDVCSLLAGTSSGWAPWQAEDGILLCDTVQSEALTAWVHRNTWKNVSASALLKFSTMKWTVARRVASRTGLYRLLLPLAFGNQACQSRPSSLSMTARKSGLVLRHLYGPSPVWMIAAMTMKLLVVCSRRLAGGLAPPLLFVCVSGCVRPPSLQQRLSLRSPFDAWPYTHTLV